ncbi:hypothetical protein EDB19DRAFT_1922083 [Suillus lakei]|nr:hypothetical protein EDB19DRAFT_1922083 [Suillus lakei]
MSAKTLATSNLLIDYLRAWDIPTFDVNLDIPFYHSSGSFLPPVPSRLSDFFPVPDADAEVLEPMPKEVSLHGHLVPDGFVELDDSTMHGDFNGVKESSEIRVILSEFISSLREDERDGTNIHSEGEDEI